MPLKNVAVESVERFFAARETMPAPFAWSISIAVHPYTLTSALIV
jgi:hypothetical protein